MSTVSDLNMIDSYVASAEQKYLEMQIIDDLEWNCAVRVQHATTLQNKINTYLDAYEGEWGKQYEGYSLTIFVALRFSISQYGIEFLERVKEQLKDVCVIAWGHSSEYFETDWHLPEGYQYDDGFCDDYVFNLAKVYPRIRKNWAKKPDREVSILPPEVNGGQDILPDMLASRIYDSFVLCYVEDLGNVLGYLRTANIPDGVTPEMIQKAAFENLIRDIQYRICQTNTPDVYAVACGGDFEAESILFPGFWSSIANQNGSNIIIAIPAKDLVFFAAENDRKAVKRMLRLASDAFNTTRHSPQIGNLFCRDVFRYNIATNVIEISPKHYLAFC